MLKIRKSTFCQKVTVHLDWKSPSYAIWKSLHVLLNKTCQIPRLYSMTIGPLFSHCIHYSWGLHQNFIFKNLIWISWGIYKNLKTVDFIIIVSFEIIFIKDFHLTFINRFWICLQTLFWWWNISQPWNI